MMYSFIFVVISGYLITTIIISEMAEGKFSIVFCRARMKRFVILDYMPRAMEAAQELMGWVSPGQLIYQVDLQEGFENIPATLQRLYYGQNLGKQLLKIDS